MGLGTGTNRLCGTGWDHNRQVRDGRHRDFICILAKLIPIAVLNICSLKKRQTNIQTTNH
jgi:hypothetical protein